MVFQNSISKFCIDIHQSKSYLFLQQGEPMNIKSLSIALLSSTLFFAGCNSMKTSFQIDDQYHFANIKTYQWVDGPPQILEKSDTYIISDIQDALDQQLQSKHLEKVSKAQQADIHLAYYLKLKEIKETSSSVDHYPRDFSGGFVRNQDGWGYEERTPDLNVYTLEEGTLVLLAYDPNTGKRVWSGTLKTKIDRSRPHNERMKIIQAAVKKLLRNFPPQS
jgi:hypothetical protein